MAITITTSGQLRSRILRCLCAVVIVCPLVAAVPTTMRSDYDSNHPHYSKQEVRRAINWYARRYRLEPALLKAVIKAESGFDQGAVSHKGAIGLMQLMPSTVAGHRATDPYDSIQNIRAGSRQLRHLLNLYKGNLRLTLAAYNAGVHRVRDHKVPPIRETRMYVRKVMQFYREFKTIEQRQLERRKQVQSRLEQKGSSTPKAATPGRVGKQP